MSKSIGIVVFPGSNCDRDCGHVVSRVLGRRARFIWHSERRLPALDALILPGGFSYGDYLRTGAIARFSPVMEEVRRFAESGGPVLGICNGFQILTEAKLLPGALMRNVGLKFLCDTVGLEVASQACRYTRRYRVGEKIRMPIAHKEGNYVADQETLDRLEGEGRVILRYSPEAPNGAARRIAGVVNREGNVCGLMPHPERCSERVLGTEDGRRFLEGFLSG